MIRSIKNILRPIKTKLLMTKAKKIRTQNQQLHPDFKCTAETERCFYNHQSPHYYYEYFGENTPICCATHLYEILRDVTKVLESSNLEYFASFGTLLGAVRHNGIIPWDTDMDIVIADSDKKQILNVLKNKFGDRYCIAVDNEEGVVGNIIRVNYSQTNTLHLDLFTYFEEDGDLVFDKNVTIAKETIFPLKKIKFYDLMLFAPKDIQYHLEVLYGKDYMQYAYKQWALDKTKFKITDFSPAKIEV